MNNSQVFLPGVFDEQGLDEIHSEVRDALKDVLRVVHIDLGHVQEGLLLFFSQKR